MRPEQAGAGALARHGSVGSIWLQLRTLLLVTVGQLGFGSARVICGWIGSGCVREHFQGGLISFAIAAHIWDCLGILAPNPISC